jgi:hypothetical protein
MSGGVEHRARCALADAVESRGPAWRTTAQGIRAGSVTNCWIESAVAAIEPLLPEDDNEDDD